MKHILLPTIVVLGTLVLACNQAKETTREVLNKTGETVGKGATEIMEGVSEGIEKTLECKLELSADLKAKGLSTGQFSVQTDSTGMHNRISVYLIFSRPFQGTVTALVRDKEGREGGRAQCAVKGNAGEAQYFDFQLQAATDVESRSTIVLQ